MSNEEMAIRIQAGERELLGPLWEQNSGLLYRLARRYEGLGRLHGLEYDDLMQCAFLALSRAVEGFQEAKGYKLTAYLPHSMRLVLREYTNIDGRGSMPETVSLNAPVGEDGRTDAADAAELGDLVPDPAAGQAFEDAEERAYIQQLHDDLEGCLDQIDPEPAQVIRGKYWDGVAVPPPQKKAEAKGMRQLRRPTVRCRLNQYREEILSHHWFHGNFSSFVHAQASSVELAAEKLERLLMNQIN